MADAGKEENRRTGGKKRLKTRGQTRTAQRVFRHSSVNIYSCVPAICAAGIYACDMRQPRAPWDHEPKLFKDKEGKSEDNNIKEILG